MIFPTKLDSPQSESVCKSYRRFRDVCSASVLGSVWEPVSRPYSRKNPVLLRHYKMGFRVCGRSGAGSAGLPAGILRLCLGTPEGVSGCQAGLGPVQPACQPDFPDCAPALQNWFPAGRPVWLRLKPATAGSTAGSTDLKTDMPRIFSNG